MNASFRSVALGLAWRNTKKLFTNPALILPVVLFPLFFLTAFAGGLSRVSDVPGFDFPSGYTAFTFAFVMLQVAAFGGVFTGFAVASDFESGFSRRLMLGAPNRIALVAGYALSGLVRSVFVLTVVTAVALVAGMQVHGDGVDLFGLVGLALIVNVAATMFATGVALRFQSIQASPAMQVPVFISLFLAPVYVPLDLLEGWIHAVSSVNPVTAFLESERGFISGEPTGTLLAFGAAIGLAVLLGAFALRSLRRAESAA